MGLGGGGGGIARQKNGILLPSQERKEVQIVNVPRLLMGLQERQNCIISQKCEQQPSPLSALIIYSRGIRETQEHMCYFLT